MIRSARHVIIPGDFMQMRMRAPASAAVPWWLVGGVAAANCIAAYQPIGAASLAASYTNLANPGTYDAAPGVAPTWASATGWSFNGSSQYLTTGVVPVNNQTWSAIVRFSNVTATTGRWVFGYYGGVSKSFGIIPVQTGNVVTYINGWTGGAAPVLQGGTLGFAGNQGYRNGIADGGAITSGSGALGAIFIGSTGGAAYINGKIQAFAIYNTTLSAAQVAAITAAMAALTG